jgi:hypothetical protein
MEEVKREYKKSGPVVKNHIRKEFTEDKKSDDKRIVVKKKMMSLDKFLRLWGELEKAGELIEKKGKWIPRSALPKSRKKRRIPLQVRIDHTRDLKEEVIKPWLKQLPDVCVDGVYFRGSKDPFKEDSKLLVESTHLFSDFRNHVYDKPDPFQLLESFRQKAGELWKKHEDLVKEISTFASMVGIHERVGAKVNGATKELAKICHDYLNPFSKTRKVEYLEEIVKLGRKPYSIKARELLDVERELESLREKMRVTLEKHRCRVSPFPGKCDFIC